MITPGSDDIEYPTEADPDTKEYSLRILVANPNGGWMWRNILIRSTHIFKVQFSDAKQVPGFHHSHTLDLPPPVNG